MLGVFLNNFKVVKPRNLLSQEKLTLWISKVHQLSLSFSETSESIEFIEKLFKRYAVKSAQISQRYLECDDIIVDTQNDRKIYRIDALAPQGVDIKKRTEFFSERTFEVFQQFYDLNTNFKRPDHLIHVTCTGYISPSAAQRVVAEKKWNHSSEVTHAYHMGCYAAMPAVRMAKAYVLSEVESRANFSVDILHTEICGLHMNPLANTPEQAVVQTLFGDGHIKYTSSCKTQTGNMNLKVLALHEAIIPNTNQDMSWIPAPWGMQMNLSREVPLKIKTELQQFSVELFKKSKIVSWEVSDAIFAIHPGGPKIIDAVQEVLGLRENQIKESRKILFERGNMSSATLPHVWNEILENKYPVGTKVISFAFGPGLTLFGSVFEIC